jgi:hypothetical protein
MDSGGRGLYLFASDEDIYFNEVEEKRLDLRILMMLLRNVDWSCLAAVIESLKHHPRATGQGEKVFFFRRWNPKKCAYYRAWLLFVD